MNSWLINSGFQQEWSRIWFVVKFFESLWWPLWFRSAEMIDWHLNALSWQIMAPFYPTGFGDSSGKDSQHIAEMVRELKKLEYINSFLILFNSQQPRLDESLRAMIQIFTQIFGAERFYDNVILGFTRWEHTDKAERKRKRSGIYKKYYGPKEHVLIHEYSHCIFMR